MMDEEIGKIIRKTIVDMVDSGELSREELRKMGAKEEEITAFYEQDLVKIKNALQQSKD